MRSESSEPLETWLPRDLAATCEAQLDGEVRPDRRSPSPGSAPAPNGADYWEFDEDVLQTQQESPSLSSPLPSAPYSPFPALYLSRSQGWPSTPETCVSPSNESPNTLHMIHMQDSPQPMSDSGRVYCPQFQHAMSETYCDCLMPVSCSLLIERITSYILEDDIQAHFANPPRWQRNHPMFRAYSQFAEQNRTTAPAGPEPFDVDSVRILAWDHALQAEICFKSFRDCQRALVEMQSTILVPQRMPWKAIRIVLRPATGIVFQRRDRFFLRRSDTSQSEPTCTTDTRNDSPELYSPTSLNPDSPLWQVPTILTFVQNEDEDSPSCLSPYAIALIDAHNASALDSGNTTVFVGSLFSLASETVLYSLFAPFGPILTVNIPRGQDCGFVQFARKEDAARAIAEMQNCTVAGGQLRLSWGRSISEKAAARAATRAGLRWVEDVA
ncbi:hypothetical protein MPSI1_001660 [Malassezia psittaci]|uniref:RRM domain-containing protein n=1 Tax=Malassezia psittaci TaxID=1821823 RepID=A0AAF0FAP1_9BASI|nr:hypothetical protein MPSI1_001660 [Malassezia psittaci]